MKNRRSLGCLSGVIVIVVIVVALVLIHKYVPSIFTAFAWIAGIAAVILIAVIVLIVLLANKAVKSLKKSDPQPGPNSDPAKTQTGTAGLPPEQAAIINKGRSDLLTVRRILSKIHNYEISQAGNDICASLDKLLQTLRAQVEPFPIHVVHIIGYKMNMGIVAVKMDGHDDLIIPMKTRYLPTEKAGKCIGMDCLLLKGVLQ